MPLKFCANLSMMFTESSFLSRYDLARRSGFLGVESAFPPDDITPEELQSTREKAKVEQILLNVECGSHLGYAALVGKESEFRQSLDRSLSLCRTLQCTRMHIMSGQENGSTLRGCEKVLRSNLELAVPLLEENNVVGLIEPINPYSVPNYFLNNYETAEKLVRQINSPNLKLQLDLFHLQLIKGDLTHNIQKLLPVTGHIQIAQVPDRHEPNTPGEIDYRYIFKLLEDINYQGWIGMEYKPQADTVQGLSWIQEYGQKL